MLKNNSIFTDGSSMELNDVWEGSCAYVIVENSYILKKVAMLIDKGTNNRSELYGVLRAMKDPINRVYEATRIVTDSAYVYKNINSGNLNKWAENNWKLADGSNVANADVWYSIYEMINKTSDKFKFIPVKAHAGNKKYGEDEYFNSIADQLAQNILREYLQRKKMINDKR